MINFNGDSIWNLKPIDVSSVKTQVFGLLIEGEEIVAATAQNGWCAVLVDGFPLGGGKVSGGRIKNHYPKGLRNLQ